MLCGEMSVCLWTRVTWLRRLPEWPCVPHMLRAGMVSGSGGSYAHPPSLLVPKARAQQSLLWPDHTRAARHQFHWPIAQVLCPFQVGEPLLVSEEVSISSFQGEAHQ